MSCVVGIEKDGIVYIGADGCATVSDGSLQRPIKKPKVFKNSNILIGFAGSFRVGYCLTSGYWKPTNRLTSIEQVAEGIRKNLSEYGAIDVSSGTEEIESQLLLGFKGKLYELDSDFHIDECTNYSAVGCGRAYAFGSLWETESSKLTPKERILRALDCSAYFCPLVCQPFIIETI